MSGSQTGITRKDFIRTTGVAALGAAIGLRRIARAAPTTWQPDRVIEGKDNPAIDVPAVQGAVSDRTVTKLKLVGRFNFGDGVTHERKTVIIRRGLEVRGETVNDGTGRPTAWATEIVGGGELLPTLLFGNTENGPFKVVNEGSGGDGNETESSFDGILFTGWCGNGLFVEACRGLAVRRCKFTNPVPGTVTVGARTIGLVNGVFAASPSCEGTFVAENNVGFYGDYSTWPDDEQLFACVLSNFTHIRFHGNDHVGHDEGLEIVLNGYFTPDAGFRSTVSITDNNIRVTHDETRLGHNWFGRIGILSVWNVNCDTTVVERNRISTTGPGTAIVLTGENCLVKNNIIALAPFNPHDLATYPIAGLLLGAYNTLPGFPSLEGVNINFNNSVVSANKIAGAAVFGIAAYDANPLPPAPPVVPPNESHGNSVFGNDLDKLTASTITVYLGAGTYDNVFKGHFANVLDLGNGNSITGYDTKTGAIGSEVSAVLRRVRDALR